MKYPYLSIIIAKIIIDHYPSGIKKSEIKLELEEKYNIKISNERKTVTEQIDSLNNALRALYFKNNLNIIPIKCDYNDSKKIKIDRRVIDKIKSNRFTIDSINREKNKYKSLEEKYNELEKIIDNYRVEAIQPSTLIMNAREIDFLKIGLVYNYTFDIIYENNEYKNLIIVTELCWNDNNPYMFLFCEGEHNCYCMKKSNISFSSARKSTNYISITEKDRYFNEVIFPVLKNVHSLSDIFNLSELTLLIVRLNHRNIVTEEDKTAIINKINTFKYPPLRDIRFESSFTIEKNSLYNHFSKEFIDKYIIIDGEKLAFD